MQTLATEAAGLEADLARLVTALAPWLLGLPGVGPLSAAQVLVSWSYAGRLRSEAAFAALAGACPIPASSGQHTRHRLNRGGDRQLNSALHTVALVRLRSDPTTRAYASRRQADGKSPREIRRCVKRAIARQRFKLHNAATTQASRSSGSAGGAGGSQRGGSAARRKRRDGRPAA